MTANRQDAWSEEEDLLLVNTVLEYIKRGQTQLESFAKVAKQLNRTPAACGFRWNATIRKHYPGEIEEAKMIRKSKKYSHPIRSDERKTKSVSQSTLDQAIHWLEKLKSESHDQCENPLLTLNPPIIRENQRLKQELLVYETLINNIKKLIEEIG